MSVEQFGAAESHNAVVAVDLIQSKVDMINKRIPPIVDGKISEYLAS